MLKHLILRAILRYKARGGGRRFGVDCNFEPTCSTYAYEAIERFGVIRGVLLAWNRLRRCYQPDSVCKCYEPVPEERDHA